jgi:hypothetical protein
MAKGKYIACKSTVLDALDGSAFEELRDEMVEWRDNLEGTGLESTDKFQAVSECADTLESAEVEEKARQVAEAIEEALEGKPFKAGCPPHVEGQKCKRCKWDGKRKQNRKSTPKLQLFDEPLESGFGDTIWAQVVDGNCYHTYEVSKHSKADAHQKATENFNLLKKEHDEWDALHAIPAQMPDEPEFEPCQVVVEHIEDKEIQWSEFRKYGKQAMNLSRSDRAGNASAGLRAAIDAIHEALEEHKDDERVATILEYTDELGDALEEVEGVEFPGMY